MPAARRGVTYADAGVDIDAGNEVVQRIRRIVKGTYTPEVVTDSHGAFGGYFRLAGLLGKGGYQKPVLVGATDGVGTKLKIAFETGKFDTVGIDCVAMSVNDLIVGGADPLFFLDYIGTGVLEPAAMADVVKGVALGCKQSGCALLGGETAEMPGLYQKGEFDLAGFAVGMVDEGRMVDGRHTRPGDQVIGIASSGVHSNGFSLVRRVLVEGKSGRGSKRALARHVPELGRTLGEELLEPTRIYVRALQALFERFPSRRQLRAFAHITGGGLLENIPRVLPKGCAVVLDRASWPVPPIFDLIQGRGRIAQKEMDRVFNNGIGMVAIVSKRAVNPVLEVLAEAGEKAYRIGEVVKGRKGVRFS